MLKQKPVLHINTKNREEFHYYIKRYMVSIEKDVDDPFYFLSIYKYKTINMQVYPLTKEEVFAYLKEIKNE